MAIATPSSAIVTRAVDILAAAGIRLMAVQAAPARTMTDAAGRPEKSSAKVVSLPGRSLSGRSLRLIGSRQG